MPKAESKWDRLIFYVIATLVFVLPLAFTPSTYISFEPVKLAVLRILSVLLIAAIILKRASGEPMRIEHSRLTLPIVFLSLLLIISTAFSLNLHTSLWGELYRYEGLVTSLNYFFLFYVGLNFLRSEERVKALLKIWLLAATLVGAYGLLQHFGIDFLPWDTASMDVSRSFSTFGNAVFLGAYLVLTIPLALALAFSMRSSSARERSLTWLLPLLVSLFLVIVLVFTYSRGAVVSFLVAVVATAAVLYFSDKRNLRAYATLALVLFLAAALALGLSSYIEGKSPLASLRIGTGGSIDTRILLWQASIEAIRERPLLGYGPDSFKLVFPSFRPQRWFSAVREVATPDKAHNEPLQTAVGGGLFGLMAYLWVMITYFARNVKMVITSKVIRQRVLFAGFFAATLAYFLQLQSGFSIISVSPLFWLTLGFAESLGISERVETLKISPHRPKRVFLWAGYMAAVILVGSSVLMSLRPLMAEVLIRRAYVSRNAGLWSETARHLEKAVALNSREDTYYLRLGEAYLAGWKSGDSESKEKALAAFLKAWSLNPWNEKVHFYLGDYYRLRGKVDGISWYEKAEDSFQRLTVLDPYNPYAYANLGLVYADAGRYGEAIRAWKKGIKLDPRQTSLFYNMARAYELQGKYRQAVIYYQKVLSVEPNNTFAHQSVRRLKGKIRER